MYSIVIKNGTIVDGTGGAPFLADIGIKKNIISTIGDLSEEKADFIFDATGFFVSPGFIDITNHSDAYGTLFYAPLQESLMAQGVSTILLGNCGESLAPIVKKESISINANWNSMEEYFSEIEKVGIGVNCATLVGHETLLRNSDDLEGRLFLLEKSLKEGALGMSSNLSFHDLNDGLMEEIKIFLKKVKKAGGIYKIHLRDEGKGFLPAVVAAIHLARDTGVRTIFSHFKAVGRSSWPDFNKALNIIEKAREEGTANISFDVFPYLRTGSKLVSLLPLWAQEGSKEDVLERLSEKATAEHIIYDLKNITLHPERILIAEAGEAKKITGKTLLRISRDWGKSPEEAILEILKINNLNVTIFGRTINQKNLISALQKDYSVVSSNGAGYDLSFKKSGDLPHPRSFGAFPRFISKLAPAANLKIEEAIKKITSIPASMLGFKNRGILKRGFLADINVFDYKNFRDTATYSNPFRYSSGVKLLLVSGNIAFLGGLDKFITREQFLGKFGRIIKKT